MINRLLMKGQLTITGALFALSKIRARKVRCEDDKVVSPPSYRTLSMSRFVCTCSRVSPAPTWRGRRTLSAGVAASNIHHCSSSDRGAPSHPSFTRGSAAGTSDNLLTIAPFRRVADRRRMYRPPPLPLPSLRWSVADATAGHWRDGSEFDAPGTMW